MRRVLGLDYVFLALIVTIVTLQPFFIHGAINFYESGIYLSSIEGLFRGGVPYRDMYILRGPLEIYLPALLMEIFGKSLAILRGYFYFGTVLTLIICAFLGLVMHKTRLFVYLMIPVLVGKTFARVSFNNWGGIRFGLGLLAILFTINYFKKRSLIWIFWAGLFSAIGFFISFEIGICSTIAILGALFATSLSKGLDRSLKAIGIYILGSAIVLIPFFLYFLITDALLPFFDITIKTYKNMIDVFTFPERFGSPKNFYEFLISLNPFNRNIKFTGPFFLYVIVGLYLLRRFVKKRFEPLDFGILSLTVYGAIIYKSVFRNVEGPPFQIALQPVILLLFLFLERIYLYYKEKKIKINYLFLIIVILFSIGYSLQRYNHRFFIFKYKKEFFVERQGIKILFPNTNFARLDIERAKGIVVPEAQADEITKVVKFIQSNTKSNEEVFTFPDLGTYNFLAKRPSLGRFGTVELSWISEDWHREVMNELRTKRPRYAIIERDISRLDPYLRTVGMYISDITAFVNNNYRREVSYGNIEIWKIKVGRVYD